MDTSPAVNAEYELHLVVLRSSYAIAALYSDLSSAMTRTQSMQQIAKSYGPPRLGVKP